MKKQEIAVVTNNSTRNQGKGWKKVYLFMVIILLALAPNTAFAHCDTMEGPLVKDAQKAIQENNVNIVLKWVPETDEAEIKDAFNQTMKVRVLSPEAQQIADKSFFDTLVRIHRAGEGVPFTGVKPVGTPIDPKIAAADKAIATGNLTPVKALVPQKDRAELTERFNKARALKNFNVNDVKAGREYIEAYVKFFKFAEGEEDHEGGHVGHDAIH